MIRPDVINRDPQSPRRGHDSAPGSCRRAGSKFAVGFFCLAVAGLVFAGCATVKTFHPEENSRMAAPYYVGTQYNAHKLMSDTGTLPALLDIGPSFVADTALLPVNIVLYYIHDRQDIAGPYKEKE